MLTLVSEDRYARIFSNEEYPRVVIVQAAAEYIPIEAFKKIFYSVGIKAVELNATKVIFDKRRLRVFHQLAMEWYFTVWKEQMHDEGIVTHRKILPDDLVFCQSAMIARSKLYATYPDAKFQKMDIKYCESISSALST